MVPPAGPAPVTPRATHDPPPPPPPDFPTRLHRGKDFLYLDQTGTEIPLTAAADTDTAMVSGADLSFNIGTGATSAAPGAIDVGKNVKVVYRVKVK
jgi:hypothetical protein